MSPVQTIPACLPADSKELHKYKRISCVRERDNINQQYCEVNQFIFTKINVPNAKMPSSCLETLLIAK